MGFQDDGRKKGRKRRKREKREKRRERESNQNLEHRRLVRTTFSVHINVNDGKCGHSFPYTKVRGLIGSYTWNLGGVIPITF
jgi:hypothetical protein